MKPKHRILLLRLLTKQKKDPAYLESIGINIEMIKKEKTNLK